jgi:hypothetical protein
LIGLKVHGEANGDGGALADGALDTDGAVIVENDPLA